MYACILYLEHRKRLFCIIIFFFRFLFVTVLMRHERGLWLSFSVKWCRWECMLGIYSILWIDCWGSRKWDVVYQSYKISSLFIFVPPSSVRRPPPYPYIARDGPQCFSRSCGTCWFLLLFRKYIFILLSTIRWCECVMTLVVRYSLRPIWIFASCFNKINSFQPFFR